MTQCGKPKYQEYGRYRQAAEHQNDAVHHSGRDADAEERFAVAAKPVIDFDRDAYEPSWRLRISEVGKDGVVSRRLTDLASSSHTATESPRPMERGANAVQLHDAVGSLLAAYREKHAAAEHKEILHALNRLLVLANSAHFSSTENLADYIGFLRDIENRVKTNDASLQRADVASDVLENLLSMTASFRDLSLSLSDIAYKLATKADTRTPSDALRTRLAQLVVRGLEKVTPKTKTEDLNHFLSAFIYASRCFFVVEAGPNHNIPSSSSPRGSIRFAALVDTVVSALRQKQVGALSPAFELFRRLNERCSTQDDIGAIAAYEVLLNDTGFNTFLEQMTATEDASYLNKTLQEMIRGRVEVLWRAGARVLVRRPVGEFLRTIEGLAKDTHESISADRLVYLFAQLNAALETTRAAAGDCGSRGTAQANKRHRDAQARYRGFLASLSGVNRLHLITMAEAPPAAQDLTMRNLNTLYNAGIEDRHRLERFFYNAVFQSADHISVSGSRVHRDIESMLQSTRSSPVREPGRFGEQVRLIVQDYQSGMPNLRGVVLRFLGATSGPGKEQKGARHHTLAVEDWLERTLIPDYDRLIRIGLACYPLDWHPEEFEAHTWYDNKLVMAQSGQYFVGRCRNGRAMLADIVDRGGEDKEVVDEEKYFSVPGLSLDKLQRDVDALVPDAGVRSALAALVLNSRAFTGLGFDATRTKRLDTFLDKLRACLQLSFLSKVPSGARPPDAERFAARIETMVKFFEGTSHFKKSELENEASRRFFRHQSLTKQGVLFLHNKFEASEENFEAARAAVVDRLFDIGCDLLEKFITDSRDETSIREGVRKIRTSFAREVDYTAYSTESTVTSFNVWHRDAGGERGQLELDHEVVKVLQKELFKKSESALKSENIDYLMPNQALAAEICRCDKFKDNNILLKMGTGQGKSIVIAMAALEEAKRFERHQEGQYVFVLTSYDHLAIHDHALGKKFFNDVPSACLTKLDDINNLPSETKIIYANVKTLQHITQDALKYQIESVTNPTKYPPKPRQLNFLQNVFAKAHRFILDEYDLVLNDLDYDEGPVQRYGSDIIDRSFVHKFRGYAPSLASYKDPKKEGDHRGTGRNKHDGERFGTIGCPYTTSIQNGTLYHLRSGGLRVSRLLAKAARVIGLSGSAKGDSFREVLGLENMEAKYFELPSSRDPESFGTREVTSKEGLDGMPGIWKTRADKEDCVDEADYIASILSDVRDVRVPREVPDGDGRTVVRPVIIFVDPDKVDLKNRLRDALKEAFEGDSSKEAFGEAVVHEKLTAESIKGSRLQEIGFPGSITLASILCGRGADIYVSPDVPDSLHVLIATSLPHERMKTQLIGRTGRMGRDGSYCVITLGKLIVGTSERNHRPYENMLHDFSGNLVRCLGSTDRRDPDLVRKWLMLASEVVWSRDKDAAVQRIENHRHEF